MLDLTNVKTRRRETVQKKKKTKDGQRKLDMQLNYGIKMNFQMCTSLLLCCLLEVLLSVIIS